MSGTSKELIGLRIAVIAIAIGVAGLAVLVLSDRGSRKTESATAETERELQARRLRDLESDVQDLGRAVGDLTRQLENDTSSTPAELLERLGEGVQYLEELSFHVELLLQALEGAYRASAAPGAVVRRDPADLAAEAQAHMQAQALLTEESLRHREQQLMGVQRVNAGLRREWIAQIGDRIGMTPEQYDRIVDLYDRQSDQWSELFQGAQSGGVIKPEEMYERMRGIRAETDRQLVEILGADMRAQFRLGERQRFPLPEYARPPERLPR